MKKLLLVFVSVALIAMLLCSCSSLDDRAKKEDIFATVTENSEVFLNCIHNNDYSEIEKFNEIKKIKIEDDCIDFYCGGAGFGSATAYVGFYYTESDDLRAIWCAPSSEEELIPYGNGYRWENSGDNRYYVEKICDGFYYYSASF